VYFSSDSRVVTVLSLMNCSWWLYAAISLITLYGRGLRLTELKIRKALLKQRTGIDSDVPTVMQDAENRLSTNAHLEQTEGADNAHVLLYYKLLKAYAIPTVRRLEMVVGCVLSPVQYVVDTLAEFSSQRTEFLEEAARHANAEVDQISASRAAAAAAAAKAPQTEPTETCSQVELPDTRPQPETVSCATGHQPAVLFYEPLSAAAAATAPSAPSAPAVVAQAEQTFLSSAFYPSATSAAHSVTRTNELFDVAPPPYTSSASLVYAAPPPVQRVSRRIARRLIPVKAVQFDQQQQQPTPLSAQQMKTLQIAREYSRLLQTDVA